MRAVELALALMAAPRGLDEVRARDLPQDMLAALKAAAGDPLTLANEAQRYRCSEPEVREACAIFVQQVLLDEGNDPFRTLGCPPDAAEEQLRQHYRWLQRWLHPDRDPEGWVSVFADRVTRAWNALKHADARAMARSAAAVGRPAPPPRKPMFAPAWPDDLPHAQQRAWVVFLPHVVVGGLLLFAAAVYWADRRVEELAPVPGGSAIVAAPAPGVVAADRRDASAGHRPEALAAAPTDTPIDPPRNLPTDLPAPPEVTPVAVVAEPAPLPQTATDAVAVAPAPAPAVEPAPDVASPSVVILDVAASMPVPAAPDAVAVAVADVPPPALDDAPPATVVVAFQAAYERGDLRMLMRLFAGDARTASGTWEQTWDDYAALFASTTERTLTLRDLRWERDGSGWVARGWMDASVKPEGRWFRQRTGGPIVVRFQPRAGSQRIVGWEQGARG